MRRLAASVLLWTILLTTIAYVPAWAALARSHQW